jgi:hypothetical protein
MKNQKHLIFFIIFLIAVLIIHFTKKNYRKTKLKNNNLTFALYERDINTIGMTGIICVYKNQYNKQVEVRISCNLNLNKGDTILIKYSIEDNSVAQIVNCNWNEELRKKHVKSK